MLSGSVTAVSEKCDRIRAAGVGALKEGKVDLFTGFPELLKKRLNVSVQFTSESLALLTNRLINPLREIEKELGIRFFLSTRDVVAHTTIAEGVYRDEDFLSSLSTLSDWGHSLSLIERRLVGLEVAYVRLLPDKANVLLNAIQIPSAVMECRTILSDCYLRAGLKYLPIDDILHISVARMIGVGDRPGVLNCFLQSFERLESAITDNPIKLTIDRVYVGSAWDLLNQKP